MSQPDDGRPTRAFCLFRSGDRPLGVDLEAVAEVVEPDRLVRLPLCPRQVLGLCTYRGRFVPVLGPGTGGGDPAGEAGDGGRAFLILKTEHGFWGLSLDRSGVSVEESADFREGDGPPIPGGFVCSGVVDRGGRSYAILDPKRSWRGLRSEIDRWYRDALGSDPPAAARRD